MRGRTVDKPSEALKKGLAADMVMGSNDGDGTAGTVRREVKPYIKDEYTRIWKEK